MTKRLHLMSNFGVGFAVLVTILLLLMVIAFVSFTKMAKANRWNVHTYEVLVETHSVSESLSNMEAGARGFAVTGDKTFLTRLARGKSRYSQSVHAAQTLIVDKQAATWLRKLQTQQQQWARGYIDPMLATRQSAPNPAATLQHIRDISNRGKLQMDAMRLTLANINGREAILLQQRSQQADRLQMWTAAILLAGGGFAAALAVSLTTLLSRNIRHLTSTNAQLAAEIRERTQAEQELQATARQLEASRQANQRILDYSLDVICTVDADGRFLQVSPACEKVWGYTPAELVGQAYIEFVHPDDVAQTNQMARDILAGFAASDFHNRYLRKDGSTVPMVWSAVWSEADKTMFCVARDDTERKHAEGAVRYAMEQAEHAREQAEDALQEAERANAAKSEFLSRMSHELRTPLNAILGFAQLMEMDELDAGHRAGVKQIIKGGRHLLELVNEVLDIARIEAGQFSLSSEPVQLHSLVEETMALVEPLGSERHIRFENNIAAGYVMADQQRLRQVLLNLLSNAVKYNREGGLVRLTSGVAADPGRVRFEVTDTGPGIPPASLEKLFLPFERLDAAQKGVEGTGIGLTISQRLVQLMGGEIGVYSIENEGSTFWVELPGAQDPMQAIERRKVARPVTESKAVSNGATPTTSFAHTILYIEDNLSNLNLLEHILARRREVKLLSAMQGRRGLELAREQRPDLILLDLHLPDMTGDKVLQQLRAETATQDIPIIMLSADATPRQIERLLETGAAEYLTKPLDVKKFLAVLDQYLEGEPSAGGSVVAPVSTDPAATAQKENHDPTTTR